MAGSCRKGQREDLARRQEQQVAQEPARVSYWCQQTGQSKRPAPMKPKRSEEGGNVVGSRLGSAWSPRTPHNSVLLRLTPVSDSSPLNDAFCHNQRAPTHCQDQGSNSVNIYRSTSWLCSLARRSLVFRLSVSPLPSQHEGGKTCKESHIST